MVQTSDGIKVVSLTSCDCVFHKSMKLPCRHIFALRKNLSQPLFDSSICDKRWTSSYYRATQRIFSSLSTSCNPSVAITKIDSKQRKLSGHEKFRKANVLTTNLAVVISEVSHIHFYQRLDLVEELIYWKSGEEVALSVIDEGV